MANPLRNIPSVNELLESPPLRGMLDKVSRNVVVAGVRTFLEDLREEVQTRAGEFRWPGSQELAERIAEWIKSDERLSLRPVINATGILLHTGLGRAPLAQPALQAVLDISSGYASLEVDLDSGERSHRVLAVKRLLRQLTGTEDCAVVNNNAAATLISLAALAPGREVIVSRGQLIEIGGSYRLPEVMAASGTILREVGTTNKTRLADYASAIGDQTAALMRCHTSNYRVVGFTEEVALADLVALSHARNLPVIDDIGSGALVDYARYGVGGEPLAQESVRAGADLVLFSGDKLLGGPQVGIILGKRELIDKITRHPLSRALRVDKMVLAALAATLRLYRDIETAECSVPLLRLLSTSVENLRQRAERLAPQIAATSAAARAEAVAGTTYLGGGSLPLQQVATYCVAVSPRDQSLEALARALRSSDPAVMARVHQDRLLLDLRSVFPHQDAQLVRVFESLDQAKPPPDVETVQ